MAKLSKTLGLDLSAHENDLPRRRLPHQDRNSPAASSLAVIFL
jgi:hypothetical protein